MVFRVRELLIRQKPQTVNSRHGHHIEFGRTVPQGVARALKMLAIVEKPAIGLQANAAPKIKILVAAL